MDTKIRISPKTAILSVLLERKQETIKNIASATKMTYAATVQTLARIKTDGGLVERTNERGFGVEAIYKITKLGRAWIKEEKKRLSK